MNISSIRAKARQIKAETPGFVMLYLVPILVTILYSMHQAFNRSNNQGYPYTSTPSYSSSAALDTTNQFLQSINLTGLVLTALSAIIFTTIVAILLDFFSISAGFTTLEVLRGERESVTFKDSLRAFNGQIFSKVFLTVLLKRFFLFLWSLLSTISFSVMAAVAVLVIIQSLLLRTTPDESLALILVLSFVLGVIGWILYIPQYYAYTQVEYLLYDNLTDETNTSAFAIIRESRRLMKGYKFKRFILDLTFIGWNILTGLTLGFAGIYVLPYQAISQAVFYEELRQQDRA